ncbi:hypothetical protein [Streptomyces chattanoogensis]|uniref:hypothetical protein n=1 Tax=Streptomyces chattanoogensis TaxID=66876 RepID=UPI0036B2ADB0
MIGAAAGSYIALQFGNTVILPVGLILTVPLALRAIREYRRGQPTLALIFLAGLVSVYADSGARFLTGLRMSEEQPVLYQAFGMPTPAWALAAYSSYFTFAVYLGYRSLSERWTKKTFWLVAAALTLSEIIFEYILIHVVDLAYYAGENQPLRVFRLPLVWPGVWIASFLFIGMVLYILSEHLKGIRKAMLIPLIASGSMGFAALLAWPTIEALHSSLGSSGVSAVATTNIAAIIAVLHAVSQFPGRSCDKYVPGKAIASHEEVS